MSTKFDSTYSAVVSMAEQLVGEGKYDSTYSAVLAIYQNLTSDVDTKFDSVYSIVVTIADGIESGEIDLGGGGSGSDDIKDYNTHKFYNMNGELVEEWTLEETQSKTELPSLGGVPFGSWTLNFDGWNWDLEQLKSASCGQNIGAMYRPSDGKTHIDIEIEPENLNFILFVDGDYTIDWGDGVNEAEWNTTYPTHVYESEGNYTITLTGTDIRPLFGMMPNYNSDYEGYTGWYYNSRIKSFLSGTKLGAQQFGRCTNLEFLTFTGDEHVYDMYYFDFSETTSLKYIAIPKGTNNIVRYPKPGKSIEVISAPFGSWANSTGFNYTFENCSRLKTVNICDAYEGFQSYAFRGCSSLQFINIPKSFVNFSANIFEKCYSLQSVHIPDSVTSLGSSTFKDCISLKNVNIPTASADIGFYGDVFRGCKQLETIEIPEGVTRIVSYMFQGCSLLKSINIPNSVTSIEDNGFHSCSSLESITIPDGVTSIGNNCFYECFSLSNVNIPNSLTIISPGVFSRCYSLKSIYIPNNVTRIEGSAFDDSTYITVDFSDNTQVPTLSSTNAFESSALILVPESLYDEWISATNWSSLSSQIKPVPGK